MKLLLESKSAIVFAIALVLCAAFAHSQVTVSIAPNPHPQFVDGSGRLLSGGFLYTYQAGTTTRQDTYVDSTGMVTNAWPIPLDATGAPSNGSTQTGIWLANQSYKFCAYNSALVLQWCTDNVTGYLAILNTANTWTQQQTFSLPLIDSATDNQMVFGAPGNQTTFDFPPPTGNITLHMPSTADTMVGRATTDTLTNKTLTSPAINTPTVNSTAVINGPGTYFTIANSSSTGTTLNMLAKLTGAPSQAVIAATTDTQNIIGLCVSGCSTTGNATIQQSGSVSCVFDGATTAGDYISISSTTAGNCHDAGASLPNSGQVIGRVLSTNAGTGTYTIDLFGPGTQAIPGGSTPTFMGLSGSAASCGTTVCEDRAGVIQDVAGSPIASNSAIANVNFGGTYTQNPACTLTAGNLATAVTTPAITVTTVQLQITNGAAGNLATGTYVWYYVCAFK